MAVKGLKKELAQLKKFEKEAEADVHEITADNATQIAVDAIQKAPVDLGKLRQGIKAVELGRSDYKVMTNANNIAPYSAYMEFGTGKLVQIPKEMKEIASRFKGAGIKEINLQPQPYLYPAFVKGRKQYLKDLKDLLKDLTKKYS